MSARRPLRSRALLLFAGLAMVAIGCEDIRRALTVPDVTLHVTDTSCQTATVRWGDGSPDDTQAVVSLPWSRDLGTASGLILVLTARRECDDEGTITAEVYFDGELEDRGTATGPYAVASAAADFF